jgi:hypothetical protein
LYLVLQALTQNGMALQYVASALKTKEMQYIACFSNPEAIKFCTPEFQKEIKQDKNFIARAWSVLAQALQWFKAEAPSQNYCQVSFAGENLSLSKDTVKKLVYGALQAGYFTVNIPEHLLADKEIAVWFVEKDPQNFARLKILQGDIDAATYVMEHDLNLLQYISDDLKKNTALAVMAIKKNQHTYRLFDNSIWQDLDFIVAIQRNITPELYDYLVEDPLLKLKVEIRTSGLFPGDIEDLCDFSGEIEDLKPLFEDASRLHRELSEKIKQSKLSPEHKDVLFEGQCLRDVQKLFEEVVSLPENVSESPATTVSDDYKIELVREVNKRFKNPIPPSPEGTKKRKDFEEKEGSLSKKDKREGGGNIDYDNFLVSSMQKQPPTPERIREDAASLNFKKE